MNRMTRRSLIGGALVLPIAGIGFGAAASRQSTSDEATPGASPSASPGASPAASPMASPSAGGGSGEEIHVLAQDIMFDTTEIRIPADTDSTITLENEGVLEHDLYIGEFDLGTELLGPGETDSITVNVPAGEYEYWCTVAGHREAGMEGILIVE